MSEPVVVAVESDVTKHFSGGTEFSYGILPASEIMEPTVLAPGDPKELGGWRILSKLGDGGMGSVYLGEADGRLAALKTLHRGLALSAQSSERFRREYAAAQLVKSPYVAAVIDAGLSSAHPYLAIEYVNGTTLDEYINRHGPMGQSELSSLGHHLAIGLEAIQAAGVTHRDLKPSNVIVTKRGPVIIDFGIALIGETQLTQTNQIVGSPGWIAPEQLEGEPVGPAADVFGWGGLMHFAATGENPFGSGNTQALMYRIVHGTPQPHGIDGPLGHLVTAALDRRPELRPNVEHLLAATSVSASASAGGSSVGRSEPSGSAVTAAPAVVPSRDQRRSLGIAAVLGLVALGVLAVVLLNRSGDAGDSSVALGERDDAALVPIDADPASPDPVSPDPVSPDPGSPISPTSDDPEMITIGCDGPDPTSLASVDGSVLGPGDTLVLERGCTFVGPLVIPGSGNVGAPIKITASDDDRRPPPVITNPADVDVLGLLTIDGSHVVVSDLTFQATVVERNESCNDNPMGWIVGVQLNPGAANNRVESVTVSGAHAGVYIDKGATENVVFDNTFVDNIMLNASSGANGVLIFGDRNEIRANQFSGHAACQEASAYRSTGAAVEIFGGSNNLIVQNRSMGDAAFVEINGPSDLDTGGNVVERNVVTSELPTSVFALVKPELSQATPNQLAHNSAHLIGDRSIGLSCVVCPTGQLVFANNIVWAARPATGPLYVGGSNLFWTSTATREFDSTGTAQSDLLADPLFADVAAGDLQLRACSPAIDSATVDGLQIGQADFAGRPVPAGEAADIGAFEHPDPSCTG